jgi:hypothetical protein
MGGRESGDGGRVFLSSLSKLVLPTRVAWQCFDLTVAHKLNEMGNELTAKAGASVAGTEGTPDADSCPKEKIIRKCPFFYMARRGLVRRFWLARSWEA